MIYPISYHLKIFVSILILFVACLAVEPCLAIEEYAEKTGFDCEQCHIDPSGGAELTDIGKGYSLSLEGSVSAENKDPDHSKKSKSKKALKLIAGFIHLFTAFFWFGTILYVHLVLKPAYASMGLPPGEVRVGLISIVVMAVTGVILTYLRVPSWDFFLSTRFGILLLIKIALFLFLVISALFVVLFIGPRLKKKKPDSPIEIGDMTLSQLGEFDGKDGCKALIGFEGNIYDVTGSKMWKAGTHMMKHNSGEDLTSALDQAPHEADVIKDRMTVVGKILPESHEPGGLSHHHVFYFMAYLNLVVVIGVIVIISLWRWW